MAQFSQLPGESHFDHTSWSTLLNHLIADCEITDTQCREWILANLRQDGYTPDAIDMVKRFDGYLASHANDSSFVKFGLPPSVSEADPFRVRAVRQLLRIGWKINTGISPNEDEVSYAACRRIAVSGRHDRSSIYFHRARQAISNLFQEIPVPPVSTLKLRFGPGATREGYKNPYDKVRNLQWCPQWRPYVSADDLVFNDLHLDTAEFTLVDHPMTKCVAVPKDARGPRIISEEPNTFMLLQQGVWSYLKKQLRAKAPEIEFESQQWHRRLLYDKEFSSLDLSDASDYVSRRLIWNLFPDEWRRFLFAFRSQFIKLGEVAFPIRAFAPMGSALCFPVEAIVHWAAVKAAQGDVPRHLRKEFSVYGDDILVHSVIAGSVMTSLRALGLQPNLRKCYIHRPFRESCGIDIWVTDTQCADVTPAYVRSPLRLRSNTQDLMQLALVQIHLYERQFNETANFLKHYISRRLPGLPWLASADLAGTFLRSSEDDYSPHWNNHLQRTEVRTLTLEPRVEHVCLEGYEGAYAVLRLNCSADISLARTNRPVWRNVPIR